MRKKISSNNDSNGKKVFIGVAWPYVNGDLHVGHLAGYLLPADICARFQRAIGNKVLMVSGSDCFGTPITVEADKRKMSPREVVDIYHAKDVHILKDLLNLSYDVYTKTDTENHMEVAQNVFLGLLKNGYIFVDTQKQYYSLEEKRFLPDRYVEGKCKNCGFLEAKSDQCDNCGKVLEQGDLENPKSKLSGKRAELRDTQHYFLNWPKLQPKIEKYVKKTGPRWKKWVYQETLGWLKQGLKVRTITRDIDWGIPLPVDRMPKDIIIENIDHKRLYVWFEAVIGYLSASKLWSKEGKGNWKDYWKNSKSKHYYFMGKDNLMFHTIFWPGQLIGYDSTLHLPDIPSINMFLDLGGKQFSKSRGVSIPIKDIVTRYGNDPVRFYLTLVMPELRDSSFSWHEFIQKNNEILVGNFGNFIYRILSIAHKVEIRKVMKYKLINSISTEIDKTFEKARKHLENCEFRNYLEDILKLSSYGNRYVNKNELWTLKLNNPEKFNKTLKQLYCIILALGFLTSPIFTESSRIMFRSLGLPETDLWPEAGKESVEIESIAQKINTSIKPKILFRKIDPISVE